MCAHARADILSTPTHKHPSLAQANRQLHSEVFPLYLTINDFRFPGGYGTKWLHRLTDKHRAQIRRLHIDLGASRRYLDNLLHLGLTPARGYEVKDAQLGWRIFWVGQDHVPEVKRQYPGEDTLWKETILIFAETQGYGRRWY